MIKIAVCDDEPFMRAEMASRISGYMEENKIPCQLHCFGGGGEILGSDMAFDILFLDIQMEGMDGMEAARLMRARGYGGMLIFITVLKEEVFEAAGTGELSGGPKGESVSGNPFYTDHLL